MAPTAGKKSSGKAAASAETPSTEGKKISNPASVKCKDKRTVMYKKYKKEKKAAKKERREQNKKLVEEHGEEVS